MIEICRYYCKALPWDEITLCTLFFPTQVADVIIFKNEKAGELPRYVQACFLYMHLTNSVIPCSGNYDSLLQKKSKYLHRYCRGHGSPFKPEFFQVVLLSTEKLICFTVRVIITSYFIHSSRI